MGSQGLVFSCALLLGCLEAQVQVLAGFSVRSVNVGTEITGLAAASGGAFGTDLYASRDGQVLRINPWLDTWSVFATGLAIGNGRPSGIDFDPGTFGTGQLYVAQNNGTIVRVAANGTVAPFSSGGALFSSNDLAFVPPARGFPAALYVTNGAGGADVVANVASNGANAVFSPASNFQAAPLGVAFPPVGSAFPTGLYVAVYLQGTVRRLDSAGAATTVATGLGQSIDLAFAPPASGFGDAFYVTDPSVGRVLRVEANGAATTFAAGLQFGTAGWDAEIAFSPDGAAMFVTSGTSVVIVLPPCGGGGGQSNTANAALLVNGQGSAPCAGRLATRLAAPGSVVFEVLGPTNEVAGIFAGAPSAPVAFGCFGNFELLLPAVSLAAPVVLGSTGRGTVEVALPALPTGSLFDVQGAVTQPGACRVLFTATHGLSIR